MQEIITAHNSITALTQFYGAALQALHEKIMTLEQENRTLKKQLESNKD